MISFDIMRSEANGSLSTGRARVIGTAGHIDHGKTALVAALTGVDTDRLPEERSRGISIDLGFAPIDLGPGSPPASVVDVPGHEAFVRNMVAGASGIDAVLFTVAADEGMMPQSYEHLLVLEALGIARGVVAVTKTDLVEPEWAELVVETVHEALSGTALEGAPIVTVSSKTGAGIEFLRAELSAILAHMPEAPEGAPFRMPVDRVFGVPGIGRVVTGTVWSGRIAGGDTLVIFSHVRGASERSVGRVRSIEVHGAGVPGAGAGQRAAIALSSTAGALSRGSVLVDASRSWKAVTRVEVECWLAESAPRALRRRNRVRIHHGTSEVMARMDWYGAERIEPGGRGRAILTLEAPIVPVMGDRIVLRTYSPVTTIGGARILVREPLFVRGRARKERERQLEALSRAGPVERLRLVIEGAAGRGIEADALPLETGMGNCALEGARADLGGAIEQHGDRWFSRSAREQVMDRLLARLGAYHTEWPLQPGLPLEAARQAARPAAEELIEAAVDALVEGGRVVRRGASLALDGHAAVLGGDDLRLVGSLRAAYREAGLEAPATEELAAALQVVPARVREFQEYLEREGELVKLVSDWYADAGAVSDARAAVVAHIGRAGSADTGACKEILKVSRKYLIPILEYLDRSGITRREGNARVLAGPQPWG